MPPFHLVPMLFTALRFRGGAGDRRRSSSGGGRRPTRTPAPTGGPQRDGLRDERDDDDDDDDDDDILALLEKCRHADPLDNVSSTEEDADESLEDWWQQQHRQQEGETPTTTTVSTPLGSPSGGLAGIAGVPHPSQNGGPICDLVRRTGDDVESVGSRVSLERMEVIPFVSLHLEPHPSRSTKKVDSLSTSPSEGDDDDDDDDDDEHSFHWNVLIARALDGDRRSNPSLVQHDRRGEQPTASREGISGTSPSSCSSGRMRTIPLRSVVRATSRTATQRRSLDPLGLRYLGPALPSVVYVNCTESPDLAVGEAILWDPARPLSFGDPTKGSFEWESHALDGQSDFWETCQQALALLTSNRRDDRLLAMAERTPELCLVRFRIDNAFQHLLHWCCRHLWLDGVRQCYRAAPEVIGFAVDNMLPLHVAIIAASLALTGNEAEDLIIEFLCKQYPAALKHTNEKLQTPLHLAVSSAHLNEATVKCILELYPTAALLADEYGWTPAHYVCQNRRPGGGAARVLRLVMKHSPSSADAVTRNLEKPIHIAARSNAVDLVRVFLEGDSDDATNRCDSESTLSSFGSLDSEALSDRQRHRSSPTASSLILCRDADGNSPVHILAVHGSEVDPGLLATIAYEYPEVKALKNGVGLTPFDLAVGGGASQDVLRILK